jgi:hypothetical protein
MKDIKIQSSKILTSMAATSAFHAALLEIEEVLADQEECKIGLFECLLDGPLPFSLALSIIAG